MENIIIEVLIYVLNWEINVFNEYFDLIFLINIIKNFFVDEKLV